VKLGLPGSGGRVYGKKVVQRMEDVEWDRRDNDRICDDRRSRMDAAIVSMQIEAVWVKTHTDTPGNGDLIAFAITRRKSCSVHRPPFITGLVGLSSS